MMQLRAALSWLVLFAVLSGPAAALDRRVRIVNESSRAIVDFYAVQAGTAAAQEEMLGAEDLPAGAARVLNFEDGSGYCRYAFRAVFDDRVELVRDSVNVCEVGTYRYTD